MTTMTRDDQLRQLPGAPDRVFYATGVLLDAEDFQAEQLYHRGRLARALSFLHGDGTVAGLRVDYEAPEGRGERVVVRPGMALDRVGRIIEVPRDACLRLDRWYESMPPAELDAALHEASGGVVADVFVRFIACPRGKTPAFAAGPFDATDAVQPARLRDGYEVKLFPRKESPPPLPTAAWAPLGDGSPAERAGRLQDLLFAEWGRAERERTRDGLVPRREHLPNQDTTSVFLARLVLPATRGAEGERPQRTSGGAVTVDNHSRLFVYPAGALAAWIGL
jgi:hypothetical protein